MEEWKWNHGILPKYLLINFLNDYIKFFGNSQRLFNKQLIQWKRKIWKWEGCHSQLKIHHNNLTLKAMEYLVRLGCKGVKATNQKKSSVFSKLFWSWGQAFDFIMHARLGYENLCTILLMSDNYFENEIWTKNGVLPQCVKTRKA